MTNRSDERRPHDQDDRGGRAGETGRSEEEVRGESDENIRGIADDESEEDFEDMDDAADDENPTDDAV